MEEVHDSPDICDVGPKDFFCLEGKRKGMLRDPSLVRELEREHTLRVYHDPNC